MSETGTTDAGFQRLLQPSTKSLTKLEVLRALSEHMTNAGLEAVAQIPSLRVLQVGQNKGITSVGLAHVADSQLETLWLFRANGINAECIESIMRMRNLKYLALQDVPLKTTDFACLKDHKTLRELNIDCGLYSREEVEKLAEQMPGIRVVSKFSDPPSKNFLQAASRDQ